MQPTRPTDALVSASDPASVHVVPARPVPPVARVSIALTGALLAGVLTSFGQAVPALATVSNSAGPWFVVAVLLCAVAGVRAGRVALPLAMLLGVVLLEVMHVGYWAATVLRGYPDVLSITNPWVLLGVPAGLLAGAVAVALRGGRRRGTRGAVLAAGALGVVAAVLVGESVRAFLRVATPETTPAWAVQLAVGVVVLVVAVVRAGSPVGRVTALATGFVGAVGVLGALLLIGG